jgi:hypothetical protein
MLTYDNVITSFQSRYSALGQINAIFAESPLLMDKDREEKYVIKTDQESQ